MGIDFLDFTWRVEKLVKTPLRPRNLFLDQHTTVAEVVELLSRRLEGWEFEFESDPEIVALYAQLHTRIMRPANSAWNICGWLQASRRVDRQLDDLIVPEQRSVFWEELSRDFSCSLPMLTPAASGESFSTFPTTISTQRQLLHFVRGQLFHRLKWTRIVASPESEAGPIVRKSTVWLFSSLQRTKGSEDPNPPRQEPWTREELWDIVRRELAAALDVKIEAVTPEAELVADLGLE